VSRGARPTARAKRRGAHAARPRASWRRRLRLRLPSAGRLVAGALLAVVLAAFVVLLNGPWLRVERIAFGGQRLTTEQQLKEVAASLHGAPLLALDRAQVMAALRRLPAVADARVDARLPDQVQITVTEKAPAFIWRTATARLVGAADGTLIASRPVDGALPAELRKLPLVDDRRRSSTELAVGDVIAPAMVDTSERLLEIEPARLGSTARALTLRIDDEHGFLLVAASPAWQVAFGLYGLDPTETESQDGRIEQQIAAVRTLFAAHPEASVSWVDARNPGKVYFRAKG
jgi:cell division septal protein FtsQ